MKKNEVLKKLQMGYDALDKSKIQTPEGDFAKKAIKEGIAYIEKR